MKKIDTAKTRRKIEEALRNTTPTEQLVKVAEMLGVKIAYAAEKSCPFCDGSRPDFGPKQVRWPCQLLKGKQYMAVNITKDPPILFRFRVIEGPYRTSGKYGWAMKVAEMPDARVAMKKNYNVRELSLGDYSVFPDEEGKWSKHNYFTFLIGEGGTEDYSGIYTHLVCKCDDVSAGSYRYHCSCSCKCPPWISEKDWSILQGHSPTK